MNKADSDILEFEKFYKSAKELFLGVNVPAGYLLYSYITDLLNFFEKIDQQGFELVRLLNDRFDDEFFKTANTESFLNSFKILLLHDTIFKKYGCGRYLNFCGEISCIHELGLELCEWFKKFDDLFFYRIMSSSVNERENENESRFQ